MAAKETALFANADEWLGRASNAAQSMATGNYEGAVYNAVPGANFQAGNQTQLYLNANSVGLRQPVIPYQQAGPWGYGADYNANAGMNFRGQTNFNQSANMSTGTKYFRNASSFSPDYN